MHTCGQGGNKKGKKKNSTAKKENIVFKIKKESSVNVFDKK